MFFIFDVFCLFFHFFQSKRKFERECKEAEKSQITFDRLDNDINATKSEVEKVGSTHLLHTCCKSFVHLEVSVINFPQLLNFSVTIAACLLSLYSRQTLNYWISKRYNFNEKNKPTRLFWHQNPHLKFSCSRTYYPTPLYLAFSFT